MGPAAPTIRPVLDNDGNPVILADGRPLFVGITTSPEPDPGITTR